MIKWRKEKLIFSAHGQFGWMNSHAQVPTVLKHGNVLRIFFSTRSIPTESKTAFIDVSPSNPSEILYVHDSPVLRNGPVGTFDEHGIMPSCARQGTDGSYSLYYSGWSRRASVPYSNLTGLASSFNGTEFEKVSLGPILTTNCSDPYSATSPFVILEGGKFFMFYCSGVGWVKSSDHYEHVYDVKLATSQDGVSWRQSGHICIPQNDEREAITRPTVLKFKNKFHMWFCYRGSDDFRDGGDAYRIGYAVSDNLYDWKRQDELAGISPSQTGWDSKMIAYPYVIKTEFDTYLFYNGNGFGQSGFGYAVLEE